MGCKMELAKSVSLGPVSGELQGQLNALARDNQQLKEENQRLGEENIRLQTYFASLNRPLPGGTPSTSIGGSSGQASRAPGSPVALPGPTSAPGAPGAAATHKIQSGDTFYSIASRYGISVAALERANPGVDSRRLRIGQSLNLPSR
jgi:hypothetical protein